MFISIQRILSLRTTSSCHLSRIKPLNMSQEESRDEDSAGNISFRKKDKSKIQSQNAPPFSWALDEEQSVPIQSQFDEGSNEKFFRSPPRSLRSSSQRQRGTPSSSRTSNFDDFSLPPEMQPENDSSFKS